MSKNKGLTLVEILVVIAIFGMILFFGLIINLNSYKASIFRSERFVLVSLVSKARNKSINNINESRWGICFDNTNPLKPKYILFQGDDYLSAINKQNTESNPVVIITPLPSIFSCTTGPGIVFDQLTGKLYPQLSPHTTEFVVSLTENTRISNISINNEGRINW